MGGWRRVKGRCYQTSRHWEYLDVSTDVRGHAAIRDWVEAKRK